MFLTGLLIGPECIAVTPHFKHMFKEAMQNETLAKDWEWAQI